MRICLCFFTYIQIASSLIPWQAASVSQVGSISDYSPAPSNGISDHLIARQPGKLLTAKDGQAVILVRYRFRLSATAVDTKVCLSLCAFALGETLREFELRTHLVLGRHFEIHPNQPARNRSVISLHDSLQQASDIITYL